MVSNQRPDSQLFSLNSQILVNNFISTVHIYLYQVVQITWRKMAFVL